MTLPVPPLKKLVLALVAVVALVGVPMGAASADDDRATVRPTVPWKIADDYKHGGVTYLRVVGATHAWGMDQAVRRIDRQLPEVRIRVAERCTDHAQCVRVRWADRLLEPGRIAEALLPSRGTRTVRFRRGARGNSAVAAHELAHVLGMRHHRQRGVVGDSPPGTVFRLSRVERQVFRRVY